MSASSNDFRSTTTGRKVLYAFLAIVLVGAGIEFAARTIDRSMGSPLGYEDPFVGFFGLTPVFEPDPADPGQLRTRADKLEFSVYRDERFAKEKAPGTFRVFCLGGSVTRGNNIPGESAIEQSYPKQLERLLASANPGRPYEVINCGASSHASYRLIPILEEVLRYDPDLVLISTGQNDTSEPLFYGRLLERDPRLLRLQLALFRSTAFRALKRGLFETRRKKQTHLPGEAVDPRTLDLFGKPMLPPDPVVWPTEDFQSEDIGTLIHYEHSVREMIRMTREAGVEIALLNLPSVAYPLVDPSEIDGTTAHDVTCHWRRRLWSGRSGLEDGRSAFNAVLEFIRFEDEVPLVDVAGALRDDAFSRGDLDWWHLFADNVHPSPRGYRVMAEAVARSLWDDDMGGEQ